MSRRALIETKFCRAPTTLLLSTMNTWVFKSTSFPKGFISSFLRTLFLFINWISRQLGRSHTESKDTCHKTLLFLLTKRSCRTQEFCRTVPRYVLTLLDDGHPWDVFSPPRLAPCKKGNDKKTHPTPHFDSRKIYGPTNLEKPTDHGKRVI